MKTILGRVGGKFGKVIALTHSLTPYKLISYIVVVTVVSSCIGKNEVEVNLKNPKKSMPKESLNITVSNIQVVNHQVVITGTNLTNVSGFQIKEGSTNTNLQIESATSTTIIANTMSNVTFAAGKIFDFIFSNAQAASTFTVNFSLCDSLLGGKGFDCTITPTDKQVLAYDAVSQKWKPKNVNGLDYRGSWDANSGDPSATTAGEYWIVSVAGGAYQVGDWHVFNGTTFDRIDNSQAITSVFGRTGVITADLNDLSDVVITAPANGQVLKFNGTNWVNSANTYTETDPNVTAFAKTTLPTCGAGQVLKADGTSLSCVTDSTGAGAFSGTASRAVVTDGAGALATSSISTTILNYLSNVTSDIQTQINAKLSSSSFVDWETSGVQTIDPTRLNLTTANRVVVTNGSSNPTASSVTSTELGYLSGATSNIQTQLNSKLSSFTETDPNVTAFAKAALPTCNAGEVLKANGTSLSCVTDNAGAGAYSGTINRAVITNGTTGELTVSSVTNTELGYLSGVTSAIQTQLNNKQIAGKITTNQQDAGTVNPFGTNAGETGEFRFYELVANGSNYTGFKAPDLLGANIIYTLPQTAPNAGEVLSSNASGVLSWIAIPSAPVTSVNGSTGVVTLTTTNINEGTNLYHTDARVLGTPITAPTLTNSAIATSDTIQVSLGKLQAQINNKEGSLTAGTSAQYYRGDKTFQTLDTLAVPENTNLYFTDARARTASVADAIADAVTNIAPSQNAVFDALALKLNSGSFIQWDQSGVQTIDPSRLNLGAPSASKALATDGSGFVVASSVTSTELGYLSGVTSSIQTQLNAKQGTLGTGSVTSTHILDGTIADADLAGSIAQSKITNLTTDLGNKQNTSSLAADVRAILLDGLSTATNAVITATDSILSAFGKLQKQITDLDGTTLKITGGTLTVGTIDGVPNPSTANQVANKAYVDAKFTGNYSQRNCDTGNVNDVMVAVGTWCVDKYEASVWSSADGSGTGYFTDSTTGADTDGNYPTGATNVPAGCKRDGSGCAQFATSKPDVVPSRGLTWYQAQRFCANAGKVLIPDDVWQLAAMGTYDPDQGASGTGTGGTNGGSSSDSSNSRCNINTHNGTWTSWLKTDNGVRPTNRGGATSGGALACISDFGIHDMVGNLWEWTSANNLPAGVDTATFSQGKSATTGVFSQADGTWNIQGSAYGCDGAGSTKGTCGWKNNVPAAALRGGPWSNGAHAGVGALALTHSASYSGWNIGFRCARPR